MFKNIILLSSISLIPLLGYSQTPCINGMSGEYPCDNVELLSFMDKQNIGGGDMNDIWGWVDPIDSTEYVIIGRTNGTSFINISDPLNPQFIGDLPTSTSTSLWRDIKVYNNHAFIVSEANGHGMQVFDLTNLSAIVAPPVTLEADYMYTGWGAAHNLVINESSGRAYGVGTNTFDGGLHIVDISDPTNPTIIGDFSNDGYTHDAQVVAYNGPDVNYQGKEIAFCCNENTITVVDVTDPSDAIMISSTGYDFSSYTHQGWLTENHQYFISNDELDEQSLGVNTTSFIWDMTDLSSPELIGTFVSETGSIDHNLYTHNGLVYQSNYRAGLRILDTENIASGSLEEVGFFDVYPSSDAPQFNGTWSNYPYFPSGVIAVSHIEEGLFLLRLSGELSDVGCMDPTACNYDDSAIEDDGSCVGFNICGGCENEELFCLGCTDLNSCNYDFEATIDDESCFEILPPSPQSILQEDVAVEFQNEPESFWYESLISPNSLYIGESYTMSFEAFPQSIWVSNSNGEFDVYGGKINPDFNNGQYHDNSGYWLIFNVNEDVIFNSVEVYSEQGGEHIIEILDFDGNVLQDFTQILVSGVNEFILNYELPAGEGYGIRSGVESPFLWRDDDNSDINFPYQIGSIASIVSTTIISSNQYSFYYFFYNWKMSSASPCLSPRTEFNVLIDDTDDLEFLQPNLSRKLVKIVDALGREGYHSYNQILFHIYDDGSVEKKFVVE